MSKPLRWSLAILILLGALYWVEVDVGWSHIFSAWRQVTPLQLVSMALLTLLSYLLRAYRVFWYFGRANGHPFPPYIHISFIHNALNNFLPMRLGEASLPLLMKRNFGVPLMKTGAGLLWIRLLDLHWLLVLVSMLAVVEFGLPWLALPVGLVIAPLLALRHLPWLISHVPARLQEKIKSLRHYAPANRLQVLELYGMTMLIWSIKLLALTSIMMVFIPIPMHQCLLAVVSSDLSSVLPIHGLAGSGTFEAAMLVALLPLGVARDTVLLAAVNVHIYLLVVTLVSVPVALLIPVPERKQSTA